MMRVARFLKVSYEQFAQDCFKCGLPFAEDEAEVRKIWESIELPVRATSGSAGYDFHVPFDVTIDDGVLIPTGIRCDMDCGWVLMLYPRSGLGFKYGVRLENSVGVIDEDFFYSDNEGHIMAKMSAKKPCSLKAGDRFAQGILVQYGITMDDNVTAVRNGGFGSTSK